MLPEKALEEVLSTLRTFHAGELGLVKARERFPQLRSELAESEDFPARGFLVSVLDATIEGINSIGLGSRFLDYVFDLLEDPSCLSCPPGPLSLKDAFDKESPPCGELHLAKCASCGKEFPVAAYEADGTFEGFCAKCGRLLFIPTDDPVRIDLEDRAYREHGEADERMPKEKALLVRELVRRYNAAAGTDPEGPLDVPKDAEEAYMEELHRRLVELRERIGGGWRDVRIQGELLKEFAASVGKCPCGGEYVFCPPPPDDDWSRPICPFCLARAEGARPVSRYRYVDEHGWGHFDRRRG